MNIQEVKALMDEVQQGVLDVFDAKPLEISARLKQLSMATGKLKSIIDREASKTLH